MANVMFATNSSAGSNGQESRNGQSIDGTQSKIGLNMNSSKKMIRIPSSIKGLEKKDLKSPAVKSALEINPRFVDTNIHKTMERLTSY